eukprot:1120617_1
MESSKVGVPPLSNHKHDGRDAIYDLSTIKVICHRACFQDIHAFVLCYQSPFMVYTTTAASSKSEQYRSIPLRYHQQGSSERLLSPRRGDHKFNNQIWSYLYWRIKQKTAS